MPNQHTQSQKIKVPCKSCGKEVIVYPSRAKKSRIYCSTECKEATRGSYSKYTKWLDYIRENILQDGAEKVAAHIGVTPAALKKQITEWRRKKIDMPFVRLHKMHSIRTYHGAKFRCERIDGKWKRVERLTPKKKPGRPQVRQIKKKTENVNRREINRSNGRAKVIVKADPPPIKIPDHSKGGTLVIRRIDSKRQVYALPDTPIEQVREQYYRKMAGNKIKFG